MLLKKEREQIAIYGRKLLASNLTKGTGGNISIFNPEKKLVAISPSGIDYHKIMAEDVVVLDLEGKKVEGKHQPSSESNMHCFFYQNRADIKSVVHTHSIFSSTLATLGWELPATNYLIAVAGRKIKCAPYARFGTQQLAKLAYQACQQSRACFLANHGMLAIGGSLPEAFMIAEMIEHCAEIHYRAKLVGTPVELTTEQLDELVAAIGVY